MSKSTTGYAINGNEFFKFMPTILHIQKDELKNDFQTDSNKGLAEKIFKDFLYLVVDDIIENGIHFEFPHRTKQKPFLYLRKYKDDAFKSLRRQGKWMGVDMYESDFSGYALRFNAGVDRLKIPEVPVYLDKANEKRITDYTNQGKQY